MGQQLDSVSLAYDGGQGLCTNSGNPTAYCPATSWAVAGGDESGLGGGYANAAYGLLKIATTTEVTCSGPCSGADTVGTSTSSFTDSFTFAGLAGPGPYYLHLQGQAVVSADLTLQGITTLRRTGSATVQGGGATRAKCSTKMEIFPGR